MTDRQTYRQTVRETDMQTDIQTNKQTNTPSKKSITWPSYIIITICVNLLRFALCFSVLGNVTFFGPTRVILNIDV